MPAMPAMPLASTIVDFLFPFVFKIRTDVAGHLYWGIIDKMDFGFVPLVSLK